MHISCIETASVFTTERPMLICLTFWTLVFLMLKITSTFVMLTAIYLPSQFAHLTRRALKTGIADISFEM